MDACQPEPFKRNVKKPAVMRRANGLSAPMEPWHEQIKLNQAWTQHVSQPERSPRIAARIRSRRNRTKRPATRAEHKC